MADTQTWRNAAPTPTSADIAKFEQDHQVKLPEQYIWFITTVTNGGKPNREALFKIQEPQGENESMIEAVYGINHPEWHYDLASALTDPMNHRVRPTAFPFGYDPGNNHLAIMLNLEHQGEVRFSPWSEYGNISELPTFYPVASSVQEFVKQLRWEN